MERKIFGALAASDADVQTLCRIRDERLAEWGAGGASCPEPLAARILIDLAESALDHFERLCRAMEDGTIDLDVSRLNADRALLEPESRLWGIYPQVGAVYPKLARVYQTYVIMQTTALVDRKTVADTAQSLAVMERFPGSEQACESIRRTQEVGERAAAQAEGYAEDFSARIEEQIVALWDIAGDVAL